MCHEFFKRNVAGMEVLIDMNIFGKRSIWKSSNLAKTKDAEFLGSKCTFTMWRTIPDHQTGRGEASIFSLFYYFFLRGNSFFIFFCWLTLPFNHFYLLTHSNFPLSNNNKDKSFLSFHVRTLFSPELCRGQHQKVEMRLAPMLEQKQECFISFLFCAF